MSLQGASFAGQGFTPTEIFDLGILDSAPGKLISVYVRTVVILLMLTTLPSLRPPASSSPAFPFPLLDNEVGDTVDMPLGMGRVSDVSLVIGDECMRRSWASPKCEPRYSTCDDRYDMHVAGEV